ncbi:MAG: hypothetical protein ACHREM_00525 [Polyangiales bacterium]
MTARVPRTEFPLTRQGVRDLDVLPAPKRDARMLPRNCDHRSMRACCYINGRPCGHWLCQCGEGYDTATDEDPTYVSGRLHSPMLERRIAARGLGSKEVASDDR